MKKILRSFTALAILFLVSCGGQDESKKDGTQNSPVTETPKDEPVFTEKPSETVDLVGKGIGPITSLALPAGIDAAMAAHGEEIFKSKCMACHRIDKKFVGPAPKGILERRTPEWIMNMILNPEEMTKNDPLAKALMVEFNGAPMANQGLTEEDARQVLEYFRTL